MKFYDHVFNWGPEAGDQHAGRDQEEERAEASEGTGAVSVVVTRTEYRPEEHRTHRAGSSVHSAKASVHSRAESRTSVRAMAKSMPSVHSRTESRTMSHMIKIPVIHFCYLRRYISAAAY